MTTRTAQPAPVLAARPAGVRRALDALWRGRFAYLFLLPILFFYLTFVVYPSLRTVWMMFMRYDFLRPDRTQFVGLANIIEWAKDPRMPETFGVALAFTLMYVPASTLLGLLVAILLDRVVHPVTSAALRTLYYFPVVLPAGILFIAWQWIFDPSWGPMNHLLIDLLHVPWPWPKWLSDPDMALPSLVIMSVWRLMGATMILFLVGLNNISRELNEAARIDGAGEWQLFRHITLPLLGPIFLVVMVLRLQVLGMIAEPLFMTQGGPIRATMTYGLQAYYITFRDGNMRMGYGATWFIMLSLFSTAIAYLGWKWFHQHDIEG
jgi:multiple sugar transport system permease protein